jgi:Flp pilus assembly protein TadD
MNSLRFGTAISAIAVATALAGCAAASREQRSASIFGGKVDHSNIGLATRAMAALEARDYAKAADLGERAVAASPRDAGFRALLGHTYFSAGRFASAEAAYRDSLSLIPTQPKIVLKLALVQIAQGKTAAAMELLAASRSIVDPADHGLALALAGDANAAVWVLEKAARESGADGRVRQNLALAHALAGDWNSARTIAAQDLPADMVDARIEQWAALARPSTPSYKVATLIGVTPAASDPGQPLRLALVTAPGETRTAQVAPPVVAAARHKYYQPVLAPIAAEAPASAAVSAPVPVPALTSSVTVILPPARPAPAEFAPTAFAAAPDAASEPAFIVPAPRAVVKAAAAASAAKLARRPAAVALRTGKSGIVVQLGAYGSTERVTAAWNAAKGRHSALRAYAPASARFAGPKGIVYRLSVQGFATAAEAGNLCNALKRSGGSCFVRSAAPGDSPVRIASR